MNKHSETETQSLPFSVDGCLNPEDERQGLLAVPERGAGRHHVALMDKNGCPPSFQCLIYIGAYLPRKLAPQQQTAQCGGPRADDTVLETHGWRWRPREQKT